MNAWLRILVLTFGLAPLLNRAASPTLPLCPPDWELSVVLSAPQLRHPSVVCCAPDGRVFVAEDPMDISAPSADLALGRILCLHPDGQVTVFAEKLYAVFGMQYLEGKLYVLHNPKFSVFKDDQGIGKERLDLIESTHPNPWALNWNDHVPANFRLAMDGYFYLAVGDKGVFGAVGQDGRRVDLHGGGILRLRPDATELEVFSTGVRNILDVALSDEDELFTYDNTDEQQWMSRLTHMVEGGYYGYPYDFIPRQPYTLWMMADYGGGAATGALAYHEDALPDAYRGNLFLADFGKRQLLRVTVARQGGSFQAVAREDFFQSVPEDFRPVGIALAPDGLSLYICDWNHRDVKANVSVGRLFKLAYTGPSQAKPKPDWYLPAALGQEQAVPVSDLMDGLSHPALSVRLTALRSLVRQIRSRGKAASGPASHTDAAPVVAQLTTLLADASATTQARWHALWALDAMDGGVAGRPAILKAVDDAHASVRRQAIRQLGTRRVREAATTIQKRLADSDAAVRFHAATALGRIGDISSVPPLRQALIEPDEFARFAAFTALNRHGRADAAAWPMIARGLASDDARVREGTSFALRETYDLNLVETLQGMVQDAGQPEPAREAALRLLARVHRKTPAWQGEWWAYHPVNAPPPRRTVSWEGTEYVMQALLAGLGDLAMTVRRASIEGLREIADPAAASELRELFERESNLELRRLVLQTLAVLKDPGAEKLVVQILQRPRQQPELLADAVDAARHIGGSEMASAIVQLLQSSFADEKILPSLIRAAGTLQASKGAEALVRHAANPKDEIRREALSSLVQLGAKAALPRIQPLLSAPSVAVRRSAVVALGNCRDQSAVPHLMQAYQDPETRAEAIAGLCAVPDRRALDAYLDGLGGKNAELRDKCRQALGVVGKEALPLIEAKLDALAPSVIGELQRLYRKHLPGRADSPLFNVAVPEPSNEEYLEFALRNQGDPGRGRLVFDDPGGVACLRCHAVQGQGGAIGPDLSTIGAQFTRRSLVESILYPSREVREGYQQIILETKSEEEIAGVLKAESSEDITLLDAAGTLRTIRKADLSRRRSSALSLMPEGLHHALSLEEFADLAAYLESMKSPRGR